MSYPSEVLADSPLAYYRLNEASGVPWQFADSSGNGRTGAHNPGSVGMAQAGLLVGDTDKCCQWTGGTGSWSEVVGAAWMVLAGFDLVIRPDTTGSSGVACSMLIRDGASRNFIFWINNHKLELTWWSAASGGAGSPAGTITGATTLNPATTYHVGAMLGASNAWRLYVNGVVDASSAASQSLANNAGQNLRLGAAGEAFKFTGRMDEIALYGVGLSSARMLAHYTASITAPAPVVPGPPTGLAVVAGVTTAALSWSAPVTGTVPTGYLVRVNGGTATDVGLVLSHLFTGLTPEVTYSLEVAGYSAGGTGAYATIPVTTLHPTSWPSDLTPGPQQWRGVHPLLTWAGVDPLVRWYDLRLCGNPTQEAKTP